MSEQQVLRGFIANIKQIPPLIVAFEFNPESINDNKAVNYSDRNVGMCGNAPGKVYMGGGHRTISFDLKLYGSDECPSTLATLRSFLYPKSNAWAVFGGSSEEGVRLSSPPTCILGFGTKILECVVTDITITEKQFDSSLDPIRAEAHINLTVIEDDSNALYKLDKERRNVMAAMSVRNIGVAKSIRLI